MTHIGMDELVFNNDVEKGIHSGGFSVKSILLKNGISPITTMNLQKGGNTNQVSDLFNDLVVPNWLLSQPYKFSGGSHKEDFYEENKNEESDDIIEDDLHDKLLKLASIPLKTKTKKNKNIKNITRKSKL
jgi:hypothetical protein